MLALLICLGLFPVSAFAEDSAEPVLGEELPAGEAEESAVFNEPLTDLPAVC